MPQPTYNQPVKQSIRRRVLEHAISCLTSGRSSTPVVRADEFQKTIEYAETLLGQLPFALPWLHDIPNDASQFLEFYQSQISSRRPGDLRVLYLSGPEPLNDLEVFLSLGIIPQNIWAVEIKEGLYDDAIEQLRQHNSFIRIHHGKLEHFFEQVNERFDLIYIDACGPLPSGKPNTLKLPLAMLQHERLAPLGMLITNFAEPSSDRHDLYTDLMTEYFAPRYKDCPVVLQENGVDPAIAHFEPEYLKSYVRGHFADVYSDFVTRFVVDLASNIVPQRRIFANTDLRRKYFANDEKLKNVRNCATAPWPDFKPGSTLEKQFPDYAKIGDIYLNPAEYPLLTFLRRVADSGILTSLLAPLLVEKIDNAQPNDALLSVGLLEHIIEGHWEAASTEMLEAISGSWFDSEGGLFCDVPLPNLLVNSLFGIYSHPYLVNPRRSLRYSYIAKSTRMYTDCLAFDQCRYYFDYWPTIDLIPRRFQSLPFQLVIRACLDRMGRHDWLSSSHPFRGAALAGFGVIPIAQSYDFSPREAIDIVREG
jgi:hypothetical protein